MNSGPGHRLRRAVAGEEPIVAHPAWVDDGRMEQRQDDVAATEDEGARPKEAVEQGDRLTVHRSEERQAQQKADEHRERDDADASRDRAWLGADRPAATGRARMSRPINAPPTMIATCANGVVQTSARAAPTAATPRRGQSGVKVRDISQTACATTATAASLSPCTQPAADRSVEDVSSRTRSARSPMAG